MKKNVTLFIAGMVMAQQLTFTQAMAQSTAGNTGVDVIAVGGRGGTTGFMSSGDYNINQAVTNYSQTADTILKQNAIERKEDKEYLRAIGARIAQSFNSLIEKKKAFMQLSQKAATTTNATLDEYLSLVNDLNAMLESIRVDLQASSLISKDTLPSQTIGIGSVKIETGAASVIDMSAALAPFFSDLEKMINDLNAVTFKTLGHKGKWGSIKANALTPDLSEFPQMTSAEVEEALAKIEQLSIVSAATQRQQQLLADITVDKIKVFIQEFGTEEFLRFRNENDRTAKAEAYKAIERDFFMRSYLRRKYGLQIGAIQPTDYQRLALNLEGLFSKELIFPVKTALNSLRSQTARGDADLLKAFNNVRQFVEQYDKKLTPMFSQDAAKKREEVRAQQAKLPENASLWEKAKAGAASLYKQAAASFASKEEIQASKPVILNDEGKDVAYNSDDTGFMARMSGVLTTMTGQVSTTETLLAVMRLVLADIREELMLSQGDWGSVQSYHFKRFMADQAQVERSVKIMCDMDKTLSNDARARARALTNNKVTCVASAPTGGILGNMRSGGANANTQIQQLMERYDKYEVARAIEARNLRQLVEAALAAGVQEGDKPSDEGLFDIPKN